MRLIDRSPSIADRKSRLRVFTDVGSAPRKSISSLGSHFLFHQMTLQRKNRAGALLTDKYVFLMLSYLSTMNPSVFQRKDLGTERM